MRPIQKNICLIVPLSLLLLSCNRTSKQTAPAVEKPPVVEKPCPDRILAQDAEIPYFSSDDPEFQKAWNRFTADGRYRLARLSDMKFTEEQKLCLGYWQSTDAPNDGGRAAIVVDSSQNQDTRYAIVVFKAQGVSYPYGDYSTYWLCKDRDLSRASLARASGYLYLEEFDPIGAKRTCPIPWSNRRHRYVLGRQCE